MSKTQAVANFEYPKYRQIIDTDHTYVKIKRSFVLTIPAPRIMNKSRAVIRTPTAKPNRTQLLEFCADQIAGSDANLERLFITDRSISLKNCP